jgi:asparagine synthetase B (glutamine-hydrolysing)
MSALAGMVRISGNGRLLTEHLHHMLRAMAVTPADAIEILSSPAGFGAIGCIRYGTDAALPAAAGPDARLLMIGELYNEQAGAHADHPAFVLAKGQTQELPADLNGSFSAAILDERRQTVTFLTDHMNSCPIFLREHDGWLYLASEVKALAALPPVPCRPHAAMILSLLTNGQLMNRQTVVEGVEQLDGATACIAGPAGRRQRQSWRFAIEDAPRDAGAREYLHRLSASLKSAVARECRLDSPDILLSGGQDSRALVSFMDQPGRVRAYTYTARRAGERHSLGDVGCAGALAHLVGMPHVLLQYDPGAVLALVRRSVAQSDGAAPFLREDVWDALHRDHGVSYILMGDECFSASSGPLAEGSIREYLDLRCLDECVSLLPYVRKDRLEEFIQLSRLESAKLFPAGSGRPAHNILNELLHRQRLFHFHNPKRRMIARHGIQVRRPLLDLPLLTDVGHIPFRYMIDKNIVQQAAMQARSDIAALPRARATETVKYADAFAELERQGGQVSSFLFDANPLLGDYFDLDALCGLVREVTSGPTEARRGRLEGLLPPQVRHWLAAMARRHLHMRSGHLISKSERLLRMICISEVLRHINRRCPATVAHA